MRGADTSEPCQDLEDKRDLGAPSPAVSADNQWKDKRVESPSWLCLDGGSTPPISTKTALSYAEGRFCGDAPLQSSGALLCLGALPLLYPEAPPSVFAFGKYTAPAVALVREVSAMLRAVFVEIRACRACASPSQLQSAALTAPFRGMRPAPSSPAGGSAASTSWRKSR